MKWLLLILFVVFGGWYAAVWLVSKNTSSVSLSTTDSLQAKSAVDTLKKDSIKVGAAGLDTITKKDLPLPEGAINTKGTRPEAIVSFAQTLMGTPYLYGSTDPAKGFDCSGFITYVFNHFNIQVPRSSIDFTNVGTEVSAAQAKPGDLILFTGTDSTEHFVGHMGIVYSNSDTLRFIHSTSGKQHGVTITPLNAYYQGRFVKTIRVFPQ